MSKIQYDGELKRLIEQVSDSFFRKDVATYQSLLYNDLRGLLVSSDEISSQMPLAMKMVSSISNNTKFVESYLGAFCYFYKFSIRRHVGIFSPPVEFGFKYDFNQQSFSEFLELLRRKIKFCTLRQQIYYSAISKSPAECVQKSVVILENPKSTRSQRKNAALLLCNSIWRRKEVALCIPDSILNKIGSNKAEAVVRLFLGKLDFNSSRALLREISDEDSEVEWCQSFFSVIFSIGILYSFPSQRSVDLIFDEIGRLRALPSSRGFEMEFDAYKCLNEDAALLFSRWIDNGVDSRWSLLADYFLRQTREFNLQSHELLRQGILVANAKNIKGRTRIAIYDYSTEITII